MYQVSFSGSRAEVERVGGAMNAAEFRPASDMRENRRGHWVIDIYEEVHIKARRMPESSNY